VPPNSATVRTASKAAANLVLIIVAFLSRCRRTVAAPSGKAVGGNRHFE
jgi:hypothetical protein